MIENSRLELKRAFTEEIKKELVAFANTDGGELIIGLADDGTVVGVENPDQISAQVTNMSIPTKRSHGSEKNIPVVQIDENYF